MTTVLAPFKSVRKNNREELFENHIGKAKNLTRSFILGLPRHVAESEGEDFHSIALITLWDITEKFDPSKDTEFWTYATRRIQGALLDESRNRDFIPRRIRRYLKQVKEHASKMEQVLSRPVSIGEAAKKLDIETATVSEMVVAQNIVFASIDMTVGNGEEGKELSIEEITADENALHPSNRIDKREQDVDLNALIDKLEITERATIRMSFFSGICHKEIGKCLGITESRVSQIYTASLIKLRQFALVKKKI